MLSSMTPRSQLEISLAFALSSLCLVWWYIYRGGVNAADTCMERPLGPGIKATRLGDRRMAGMDSRYKQ